MASAILSPVGEAIVAKAEALTLTPVINGYWLWPGMAGLKNPACTVGVPEVRRTGVDEKESQLGASDWHLEYPVEFSVDLDEALSRQAYLAEAVEAFVAAIDADRTLAGAAVTGAQVIDARASDFSGAIARQDLARPLLTAPGTVAVWVLKNN